MKKLIIFADFDGTVTRGNATDTILSKFAGAEWKSFEEKYLAGELTLKESIEKQFIAIRGTKKEILRFARKVVELRDGFKLFTKYCRDRGYQLKITSEGLDFIIAEVLNKENLKDIEVFANKVVFKDKSVVAVEFPYSNDRCKCHAGNCKLQQLINYRSNSNVIVYIGDDYTDFCPSEKADIIFARDKLANYCRDKGIDYFKYNNFYDVIRILADLGF